MPPCLRDDAVPRVDDQDRQVGGAGAGHHVARVLLVAGRVGDDEFAQRRREIPVGDVDRDALLALGAEAVGQQRQVERPAAALRSARDRGQLVGQDGLGVVEQASDQRALAVVDASRRDEAQHAVLEQVDFVQRRHQK